MKLNLIKPEFKNSEMSARAPPFYHRSFIDTVADFFNGHGLSDQEHLIEHTDSFTVTIDLPGLSKHDIHVEAFENKIIVRAAKASKEHYSVEGDMYLRQRSGGSYVRTFDLPCSVDKAQIYANYNRGSLEIFLPKLTQPSKIEIQEHDMPSDDCYTDDLWSEKSSSIF